MTFLEHEKAWLTGTSKVVLKTHKCRADARIDANTREGRVGGSRERSELSSLLRELPALSETEME